MKIINLEIDDERWAKLKVIADGERRHIKHQAALVLENWIDRQLPVDGAAQIVPVPLATGTPMVRELAPATSPATVQEV